MLSILHIARLAQIQAVASTAVMALVLLIIWFIRSVYLETADAERQMEVEEDLRAERKSAAAQASQR